MASTGRRVVFLVIANALLPLAISIFAIGFFPYKPYIPGQNVYRSEESPHPPAVFDKLLFMVVDALRRY
jgi:ethanolamine phosphate transferase 2 subunit G